MKEKALRFKMIYKTTFLKYMLNKKVLILKKYFVIT